MELITSPAAPLLPTLVPTTSADEDAKVAYEDEEIWRPPSCRNGTDDESERDEDGYGGGDGIDVDLDADDPEDLCGYEPREMKTVPLLGFDVIKCDPNDDSDKIDYESDDDEYQKIISRPIAGLKLSFDEAPEFVERLKAYNEVKVGDAVTFIATFRAVPTPTVKWYKDEEEVRPTLRHHLEHKTVSTNEGTIRLTIDDVRAADEGAYKVKVENQEGVASTTGYLSVSGVKKPRTRKRTRSPSVSTPPFLRPIAEQKSMEESEELELSRQPPSPLQSFIDSIRRSAKSKHPPIYYGTSADIFAIQTDDVSPDQLDDENNSVEEDDDEVFNVATTPTSSDSPLELLAASVVDAVSTSCSGFAEIDNTSTEQMELQAVPTISRQCLSDVAPASDSSPVETGQSISTLSRRRLGDVQLQHRLALDLPDYHLPSEQPYQRCVRQQPAIESGTGAPQRDNPTSGGNASAEQFRLPTSTNPAQTPAYKASLHSGLFKIAQNFLLTIVDHPKIGLYLFFIAVSAALANAFEVHPICLVITVSAVSFVSFLFVEQRSSCRRPSPSPPPSSCRPTLLARDCL